MHFATVVDNGDLWSLGTEQHGVYRNRDPWNRSPSRKMHLPERAGQELAILVGNIHFGVQGAGRGIDGIGGADHRSQEFLAGIFLQRNVGLDAHFYRRRIGLRNADVNTKRIDARDVEHLSARRRPGVDESAGIDIAARKHAGKRSVYILERLKLFETADIRIRSGKVRERLLVAAGLLVGFLLRNRVRLAQIRPTVGGDLGQCQCGFDLLTTGPGLRELLIDFRCVDRRQQFTLLHLASNVLVPAQKVAIRAGKNGGLDIGLQVSRQHQFVVSRLGLGLYNRNVRDRDGFGFLYQRIRFASPVQKSNCARDEQHDQGNCHQHFSTACRGGRQIGRPGDLGMDVCWMDLVLVGGYGRRLYWHDSDLQQILDSYAYSSSLRLSTWIRSSAAATATALRGGHE